MTQYLNRRTFLASVPPVLANATMGTAATAAQLSEPPTPDQRIEAAITEIKAAMSEKFPGWRVQVKNDFQHVQRYEAGQFIDGDPYCHAVLIYGSSEKFGPEDARWMRVYLPDNPTT